MNGSQENGFNQTFQFSSQGNSPSPLKHLNLDFSEENIMDTFDCSDGGPIGSQMHHQDVKSFAYNVKPGLLQDYQSNRITNTSNKKKILGGVSELKDHIGESFNTPQYFSNQNV